MTSSLFSLVIPDEQPLSYNRILRTHWKARSAEAQRCKSLVSLLVPPGTEVFSEKVDIALVAYYSNLNLLKDNCNLIVKFYVDGLLGKVIVDDAPRYVRSVIELSRLDREKPRLEIYVNPVFNDAILWRL